MKMYPIAPGCDSAYQSKENIRDLNKLVKERWDNISKAIKALGIKIRRRP